MDPGGTPYTTRAGAIATAVLDVPHGRVLHTNARWPGLLAALGRTSADVADRPWSAWWFGDTLDRPAFDEVVQTCDARTLRPLSLEHRGRRTVWDCALVPVPAAGGAGDPVAVVLTCADVTDAALAHERLVERVHVHEQLLAHSGHELRGPLAPLAAYSEVLRRMLEGPRRDVDWDRQAARVLASFDRQVRLLTLKLDDLLDLARLERGVAYDRQPLEIGALLDAFARAVRQAPGNPAVKVVREPSARGRVIADPGWLARAVQALASEVWARSGGAAVIRLRGATAGAAPRVARFEVASDDTDEAPAPSAPVPHGAERGHGPGLAWQLARTVAEQHGGRLATDGDGGALRFWIEIPVMEG